MGKDSGGRSEDGSQFGTVERKLYNSGNWGSVCAAACFGLAPRVTQFLHHHHRSVYQGGCQGDESHDVQASLFSCRIQSRLGELCFQVSNHKYIGLDPSILNYRKEERAGGLKPPLSQSHAQIGRWPHLAPSQETLRSPATLCHVMEIATWATEGCVWTCCFLRPPASPKGLLFKSGSIRITWDASENRLLGPIPLRPAKWAPPV